MKYVNKISVLLSLLVVVLFSACNADQEGPLYTEGKGLSFVSSTLNPLVVSPSSPTFTVDILRGTTEGELEGTVQLYAYTGSGETEQEFPGCSVTGYHFADGENKTTITVDVTPLAIGQAITVELQFDSENVAVSGNNVTEVTVSKDYTWNNLGKATFYDNQFFYWYNEGNGVKVDMYQAAEQPNRYKLASPYAEFNAASWPASELSGFTKSTMDGDFVFLVQEDGTIVYNSYRIGMTYTGYGAITLEHPTSFGASASYNRQIDEKTFQLAPMYYMEESGAGFNCMAYDDIIIIKLGGE